jgi:RNA polymerase sigma factor (sigma-70 family)
MRITAEDLNQGLVRTAQAHTGKDRASKAIYDRAVRALLERNRGLIYGAYYQLTREYKTDFTEDILNVCRASIIGAIATYKFNHGSKFISWWVYRMRSEFHKWQRDQGGEIYLQRATQDRRQAAKTAAKKGNAKIARALLKRAEELAAYRFIDLEMKRPGGEDNFEVDLQARALGAVGHFSAFGPEPDESLDRIYKAAEGALPLRGSLSEKDKVLLDMRHVQRLGLGKIGDALGICKERARQLVNAAQAKVKYALKRKGIK